MRALPAIALALVLGVTADAGPAVPDMRLILASAPAQTLSEYRLFLDAGATQPSPGVIAYDLGTPLFSDYALKSRYLFTPPGTKTRIAPNGDIEFPVGSVLVKTFSLPADVRHPDKDARQIETRLLIRKARGWTASSYLWDETSSRAALHDVGAQVPHTYIDQQGVQRTFLYAVPNRNQCKACHNVDGTLTPLGPRVQNLDHDVSFDGVQENQLSRWERIGALEAAPAPAPRPASLDQRARTYLDVNCAHCHNPRGPANNSGLDLSYSQTEPERIGIGKRPVAAGRGSADFLFDIDPGHPERSILLHRMASTDPAVMMPELGRALVHQEGVALMRDWIASMPPMTPSPTITTGEPK